MTGNTSGNTVRRLFDLAEKAVALYFVYSQKYVVYIPYCQDFGQWPSRLADEQFESICNGLRGTIDGEDLHTAGWIPGNDWTGTTLHPTYTDPCDYDQVASATVSVCSCAWCCGIIQTLRDSRGMRSTEWPYEARRTSGSETRLRH